MKNDRKKSVCKLQKIYAKIENARKDTIHKATTWLTKTKSVIVVEDLNINGITKNHNLASAIHDAEMGVFMRQMKYKAQWYGSEIKIADRFYPSSKMCSICGYIKPELSLSERVFKCDRCLAASSAESLNACLRREVSEYYTRCPPVMQESDTIRAHVPNG